MPQYLKMGFPGARIINNASIHYHIQHLDKE